MHSGISWNEERTTTRDFVEFMKNEARFRFSSLRQASRESEALREEQITQNKRLLIEAVQNKNLNKIRQILEEDNNLMNYDVFHAEPFSIQMVIHEHIKALQEAKNKQFENQIKEIEVQLEISLEEVVRLKRVANKSKEEICQMERELHQKKEELELIHGKIEAHGLSMKEKNLKKEELLGNYFKRMDKMRKVEEVTKQLEKQWDDWNEKVRLGKLSSFELNDVEIMLIELELSFYIESFKENKVNGRVLAGLNEEQMKKYFGMEQIAHRKRLLWSIHQISNRKTIIRSQLDGIFGWSIDDVLNWLRYIQMEQYCEAFSEKNISGRELLFLREADLEQFGIHVLRPGGNPKGNHEPVYALLWNQGF
eukprot:TRINITY_DN5567_c0_g1_i1.p1 TRINITY_DN5567_c0_g1~~TRINITY_DN5567_c0_g1_i1.p1  ORF type:complete len:366 (+),score=71.57 TRINITY_DN5567_c0_g1_i1:102-1199(+)